MGVENPPKSAVDFSDNKRDHEPRFPTLDDKHQISRRSSKITMPYTESLRIEGGQTPVTPHVN
jgi:hypothetical protein